MKTPPFLLLGCPVLMLAGAVLYFATFRSLHHTPFHVALTEAETVAEGGPLHDILSQLNLTAAQHQQIDQIRQTINDHTQRRAAILQVLTPEQRAKFEDLRARQQKDEAADAASVPAS